jgi:hypothetical protein
VQDLSFNRFGLLAWDFNPRRVVRSTLKRSGYAIAIGFIGCGFRAIFQGCDRGFAKVMLFLLGDVGDRPWALLAPYGKDAVSPLPAEGTIAGGLVIEMVGAAALDLLDKIGDRHIRRDRNHHMDMVTHAIQGLDHAAQGISLAPNVGEQNSLAIGCD